MQTFLPLTRKGVLSQAWPVLLSQASIPLVGLVDTIVIGRTGQTLELAGVALGVTVMSFIFWSFGFLRMGVTGLTARAVGEADPKETQSILLRSVVAGTAIGALLFALQLFLIPTALKFMQASQDIEGISSQYMTARMWGAPAILACYAINGWLLGQGKTACALILQIITNSVNIGLDIYFVQELGMGAKGVGLGTAIAEWTSLLTGIIICSILIILKGGPASGLFHKNNLFALDRLKHMFAVNANIMIRTIALLGLMTWFANSGARQGGIALAANHVLLQIITVSAFILDAFAVTAEARVGAAIGAKSRINFWRAVRLTTEFAVVSAIVTSILIALLGPIFVDYAVADNAVVELAKQFIPIVALAPILGVASWQLDGIFIGATNSSAMRNSTIIALIGYIALDILLRPLGNWGVWIAFIASYVLRAITLGAYFPSIAKQIETNDIS